jgi:AcrR family transcriptional regulator
VARPRKISDDELLAAAATALGRYGPRFTLAQIAEIAGVATATAAARVGSKHELLRWMTTAATQNLATAVAAVAARAPDPVAAVRAGATVGIEGVEDPATIANHLAQFGVDLGDPELRAEVARMWEVHRHGLERLIAAADLPGAPPPAVAARILVALGHGTQVQWAVAPDGSLRDRLTADIEAVLTAWAKPS